MKRFLRKLLLYVIGFGIGLLILANVTSYSKGERTGHIVKLEKKGLLFKTWEGSLDMSIFQGARPNKGNVENTLWTFTVSDDKIAQQIQDANMRGNRVILHYKEKYMKLFWIGDTKYIVIAVDEVKENPPQSPSDNPPIMVTQPGTGTKL